MNNIEKKLHIGMIMDWNRRWAKNLWKTTFQWHKSWFENAKKMIEIVYESKEVWCFTLWALSKENIQKRSEEELSWLFSLINTLFDFESIFQDKNIKFDTIWNLDLLPKNSQEIISRLKDITKNNNSMDFVIALWYSWQDEIVRATQKIIKAWVDLDSLDEKIFRSYLDISKLPVIDLIIRTWIHEWTESVRHSWFLLYDSAYGEYYFTHTLWPDFDKDEFYKALAEFKKTKRTKGK